MLARTPARDERAGERRHVAHARLADVEHLQREADERRHVVDERVAHVERAQRRALAQTLGDRTAQALAGREVEHP